MIGVKDIVPFRQLKVFFRSPRLLRIYCKVSAISTFERKFPYLRMSRERTTVPSKDITEDEVADHNCHTLVE